MTISLRGSVLIRCVGGARTSGLLPGEGGGAGRHPAKPLLGVHEVTGSSSCMR